MNSCLIDFDYIDFDYLEANSCNINFKRGSYRHNDSLVDQIKTLENELFFDTQTTFAEKVILLKENENDPYIPQTIVNEINIKRFNCQFCLTKSYKVDGTAKTNHEKICSFNLVNKVSKA